MEQFHVISGLPRSGTTMLEAILRQNPRFHAAISSPVVWLLKAMMEEMSAGSVWRDWYDDARRERVLRGVVENYYGDVTPPVVFDTNHTWTGKLPLLHRLYPNARVICCVRDVSAILNSVERVLRQNPLQTSSMFKFQVESSVYARTRHMMDDPGFLKPCWEALREAWFGPFADKLILVEYDKLVADPKGVLDGIYTTLGQPLFGHDFQNFEYEEAELDHGIGMPGMHCSRGPVRVQEQHVNYLPPDLVDLYASSSFWRDDGKR